MKKYESALNIVCLMMVIAIVFVSFFGLYQIYFLTNLLVLSFVLFVIGLVGTNIFVNIKVPKKSKRDMIRDLKCAKYLLKESRK